MKSILLFTILVHLAFYGFSQTSEFENYYPENRLYKKLKVKSVLNTIASPPNHHYKMEYDALGRQTAWYYVEDSVKTHFQYLKKGDTLIRYHCCSINGRRGEIYRYEKFLYDSKGRILMYQDCETNYDKPTVKYQVHKFFYDENGDLMTSLIYLNRRYKEQFSVDLSLKDSLLKLIHVYAYTFDKSHKLLLRKRMMGRPADWDIDSFYYDKRNRLIKKISHQAQGFAGEFSVNNITQTDVISYGVGKMSVTSRSVYLNWDGVEVKLREPDMNEYVYYPNGLTKIWYYKIGDGTKSMVGNNLYEF